MRAFNVKQSLKQIRSFGTFWIAEQTLDHLKAIRTHELDVVLNMLPPKGKLLEIGAGTGWQSLALEKRGYSVSAIDLPLSDYVKNRVYPIIDYDGSTIPFPDNTFDIVFSSNVLEHIPHVHAFQKEIHRILKPEGSVLHVLPSSSWRFWTNISHVAKTWWPLPGVHGEHAGNSLAEIYYFSRRWWTRLFAETGWRIVSQDTTGLFYTGASIMDSRLNIDLRRKMSRVCGSSCNVFVLKKSN
jgi:SAM-dependent methyltransferase